MCLYCVSERKIAKKDIECCVVRICDGKTICSPYCTYWWAVGKTEHNKKRVNKHKGSIFGGAFHSLQSISACRSLIFIYCFQSAEIYKAIIPKGSAYYVGTFNLSVSYASKKLKLVERVV